MWYSAEKGTLSWTGISKVLREILRIQRIRASEEALECEGIRKERTQTLRIGAVRYKCNSLYCASRDTIKVWKFT